MPPFLAFGVNLILTVGVLVVFFIEAFGKIDKKKEGRLPQVLITLNQVDVR